jgi:hypothetical protein
MEDANYGKGEFAFPDSPGHREFVREYLTRPGGPEEFRDALSGSRESTVESRQ